MINLLAYVRKAQKEKGRDVEFTDLADFEDVDDKLEKIDEEELTLYKQALAFYEILKNTNPMSF